MGSTVDVGDSSGEDTDFSDSEKDEYVEKAYQQLLKGKRTVKVSDHGFNCPYCSKTRKRDFQYNELMQHASAIGNCASEKRSLKDKANHLALAKYLGNDHCPPPDPAVEVDPLAAEQDRDSDELFVWPWIGIVVNIPTQFREGRYVGESGSKLRDELTRKGFNPTRVRPLWNYQGHSGTAIVEFLKDWSGFGNAMSFEKEFGANHHGKINWLAKDEKKSDLYGWVARADDYNSSNIVGDNLRKIGDLRTVSDIMEEEARKTNKLLGNLSNVIQAKNMHLIEMENKFKETESKLTQMIAEKDSLHQTYNEELKKIESSAREHFKKILNDHEKQKLQLETQKRDLELRGEELSKRETHNEIEKRKLAEDLEKNAVENCTLQAAAEEQKKADEKVIKLAEEQKIQKEKLHKKVIQLEEQLNLKQRLELEIEQMRGKVNVMKHMDLDVLDEAEALIKAMSEKKIELEEVHASNRTLIVHEHNTNHELQEARKELIRGLQDISVPGHVGIKRMGELNEKPFYEAMASQYGRGTEGEEKAMELVSTWQEYLKDPAWHPLKVVIIDGKEQQVITEDDEKLRDLKEKLGDEAYDAVTAAIIEINENNASGGYVISELWNYEEARRGSLREGLEGVLEQWGSYKRRRGNYQSSYYC